MRKTDTPVRKILPTFKQYREVEGIIKQYTDLVYQLHGVPYLPFAPRNLRTIKDWNSFYKFYIFLKSHPDYDINQYLYIVLRDVKPTFNKYVIPCQLLFYEKVYLRNKESYAHTYGKCSCSTVKESLYKDICHGIIWVLKRKQAFYLETGTLVEDINILLDDYKELPKSYLIIYPDILDLLIRKDDLLDAMFESMAKDLKNHFMFLSGQYLIEFAKETYIEIHKYIDESISNDKVIYTQYPLEYLNKLQIVLETSELKIV
jgi:hypothetical protein